MPSELDPQGMQMRRPPRVLKLVNRIMRPLLTRGHGPTPQRLLVLTGRRSGAARATPVAIVTDAGNRYIVAGYATADWVGNARANPEGALVRGMNREPIYLTEVPVEDRPPILRVFLRDVPGGRRFLTVSSSDTDEELAGAAHEHPVFRVTARPPRN